MRACAHRHVDSKNLPDYDPTCVNLCEALQAERREYQSLDDILVALREIIIAVL